MRDGKIKTIQLNPSRSQLLYDIIFKDQLGIKIVCKFVKTKDDEEVMDIPHVTKYYI